MASAVAIPVVEPIPIPIPIRAILPWAAFIGLTALPMFYFIGGEAGDGVCFLRSLLARVRPDGRHILGFPATERRNTNRW